MERELIRAYHEDGDLDALDHLVESHRPMAVREARKLNRGDLPLAALVEYGMLGLRIAAGPARPSKTKKGKSVGFDPDAGNRFNTYARKYAVDEMRDALSDGNYPKPKEPRSEAKAKWQRWHEQSGPIKCVASKDEERHKRRNARKFPRFICCPSVRSLASKSTVLLRWLLTDGFAYLSDWRLDKPKAVPHEDWCRKPRCVCGTAPAKYPEPPEPWVFGLHRKYLKHPVTKIELGNRDMWFLWGHSQIR